MPTNWNHLGYVTIDTARLLLVDPTHVGGVDANNVEAKQIGIPGGDFSAVVVPTGLGDGRYPVEGRYAELPGGALGRQQVSNLDTCLLPAAPSRATTSSSREV